MSTYKANRRGSILLDGVLIPFESGCNVTALAAQVMDSVLKGLIADHIWEDVTVEIKEAQKNLDEQIKKVDIARKAKFKK